MRHIIHMYMPHESQQFFVPSKAAQLRFQSIGYTNYAAAMAGNISGLSDEQQTIVTKILVGLRHTFTRNSSILFHQGTLKLKGLKFSYRESLVIEYSNRFARLDLECITHAFSQGTDAPQTQPDTYMIACPQCKCVRDVAHIALCPNRLWKSMKCGPCARYRSARQWLCNCSIPWHSCADHALKGHACG